MGSRRILEGLVLSNKMQKTIVVVVEDQVSHRLYRKMFIKKKKYKVHDQDNKANIGDRVKIIEARPLSKEKRFRLLEIIS